MLRLIGIVISIGLADSLNPSTVGPALYLASGPHPRRAVAQFSLGVFLVYLVGGCLIAIGPGQLVLSLVPKPGADARHVLEVAAGVVLIAVGVLLWIHRARLGGKPLPYLNPKGHASWLLGATISAVELPTAFPYFTVLAAVVGSGMGLTRQVILVVLFNVCFVLPLVAIVATLALAGERGEAALVRAFGVLERRWPALLAALAVLAGMITIALGATGTYRVADRLLRKRI